MDGGFAKWVWMLALLVGIANGLVTLNANQKAVSMEYMWAVTTACILVGVIAVCVHIKYWCFRSMERRILLGEWLVTKEGHGYEATWKFDADGTTTVITTEYLDHGRWRFKRYCIYVQWDSLIPSTHKHCWETFCRPLKTRDSRGRSWEDDRDGVSKEQGCVRAKKIRDTT